MPHPARPASPQDGVAWVTGASSGIGLALTRRLVSQGWRVAVTARRAEALSDLAAEAPGKIAVFAADVSDTEAMATAAAAIEDQFGPIALAVLNAGVYLPVDSRKPDPALFRQTFEVNLMGVANALAPLVPAMLARKSGQILIVSSATGFGGMPTSAAYGASKAALINMAECLRIELDPLGVRVQVATPGFVETPAQDDNRFPKPFMISPDRAAQYMTDGMATGAVEISFPRRFTWLLKALYALPKRLYVPLVRKQTGWDGPNPDWP
jgi:NAD(P)-dependent dehydrogenase (short-subunit alcohol dehydrogenase family)